MRTLIDIQVNCSRHNKLMSFPCTGCNCDWVQRWKRVMLQIKGIATPKWNNIFWGTGKLDKRD